MAGHLRLVRWEWMRYINLRFTFTYLLTVDESLRVPLTIQCTFVTHSTNTAGN